LRNATAITSPYACTTNVARVPAVPLGQAFLITATGVAAGGTGQFTYTIDEANNRQTTSLPAGRGRHAGELLADREGADVLNPAGPARGFTLIEMVVVVAIVGILVGLGASNYSAWITNSRIRTAAETLASGLNTARNEAIKRNRLVRFHLVSDLGGGCALSPSGTSWVVSLNDPTVTAGEQCDIEISDTTRRSSSPKISRRTGITGHHHGPEHSSGPSRHDRVQRPRPGGKPQYRNSADRHRFVRRRRRANA
jgi:prepilin-type N-terminal cleavage/methylation domain-containing protein